MNLQRKGRPPDEPGSDHVPSSYRPATDVFQDHLVKRLEGDVEADLACNYSPEVLVLTSGGRLFGHDGIRETSARLDRHCGGESYRYLKQFVEGDWAYLVWEVRAEGRWIHGGDAFCIVEGLIRIQTIHYVVVSTTAE